MVLVLILTKENIIFLFIIILFFYEVRAQISQPNIIHPLKTEKAPLIDGVLNDECWTIAHRVTNFTQREPNEGEKVSERTEVALVYTNSEIYIGIWCYQSSPIIFTAKYMKRDFYYLEDDNFEILFDTFFDKRNGYIFVINPNRGKG